MAMAKHLSFNAFNVSCSADSSIGLGHLAGPWSVGHASFGDDPILAYQGLFQGAFGSGRAWSSTIRKMIPLILTGLSVAVAFKAGLFNIGASGQFVMGSVFSVAVGIHFEGLPMYIHLPMAILAGMLGG